MAQRLLLCDDEIHILRAAEFKLKRAGYDVQIAVDGEEAWEAIQQQLPVLVITDCQMPRLDGLALAERIRNTPETQHLPVMMLSAKGFELSAEELASQYGIVALLHKPFSPRELLHVVQDVLGQRSMEATAS